MNTPLTTLTADIEGSLVGAMTTTPLTLIVIYVILRKVPYLSEWFVYLVIWAAGIAIGIVFADDDRLDRSLVMGFIQGSLAMGAALAYATGARSVLKEKKEGE